MTKTAKQILQEFERTRKFDENPAPRLDQALKELEAIHQQEIAKARIDEINRSFQAYGLDRKQLQTNMPRDDTLYTSKRIAELSQTLKEHKD